MMGKLTNWLAQHMWLPHNECHILCHQLWDNILLVDLSWKKKHCLTALFPISQVAPRGLKVRAEPKTYLAWQSHFSLPVLTILHFLGFVTNVPIRYTICILDLCLFLINFFFPPGWPNNVFKTWEGATTFRNHISTIVMLYHDTATSTTTITDHHLLLLFRLIYIHIHIHTGFECIFNITMHYCKIF